jgi:hypothetical protein
VAITATFRQQTGTAKTVKSSAGDGTITLASLANGSYRQSTKVDLGATFAREYRVVLNLEFAATPTNGNYVTVWANGSSSATAATDNRANCSGSDQAYTGYSSNASASVEHLQFVGQNKVTAQATATVQSIELGVWCPVARYNSFVILNSSGAAIHSSDANCVLTLSPVEGTGEA